MYNEISHKERLEQPYQYPAVSLLSLEMEIGEEETIENNVILHKSVVKQIDPVERMSNYKASDFSLHNLIAIGADKGLKEVFIEPTPEMMEMAAYRFNELRNITSNKE